MPYAIVPPPRRCPGAATLLQLANPRAHDKIGTGESTRHMVVCTGVCELQKRRRAETLSRRGYCHPNCAELSPSLPAEALAATNNRSFLLRHCRSLVSACQRILGAGFLRSCNTSATLVSPGAISSLSPLISDLVRFFLFLLRVRNRATGHTSGRLLNNNNWDFGVLDGSSRGWNGSWTAVIRNFRVLAGFSRGWNGEDLVGCKAPGSRRLDVREKRGLMRVMDVGWRIPVRTKPRLHHLQGIPPISKNITDPDVADGEIPLKVDHGKEIPSYKQLDPTTRLLILKALCEVRSEQDDILGFIAGELKKGTEVGTFRKERVSACVNGVTYCTARSKIHLPHLLTGSNSLAITLFVSDFSASPTFPFPTISPLSPPIGPENWLYHSSFCRHFMEPCLLPTPDFGAT
ncbi:hypothetical protein KSP40_PGU021966 [Platanthera guangdongensis]|uniref:Uncharacterized protein n=1 Tax=Platanthera guangdongensis TaxID=2320717 RepID=A0ABR2MDR6_9ASPA